MPASASDEDIVPSALRKHLVFMTGVSGVSLAQCIDTWGGKEAMMVLWLSPDSLSLSNSQ